MGIKIFENGAWREKAEESEKSAIEYSATAAENIFLLLAKMNEESWRIYSNYNSRICISGDRKILAFHMRFSPCESDMIITQGTPCSYHVCSFKKTLGSIVTYSADFNYHTYDNTMGISLASSSLDFRTESFAENFRLKGSDPFAVSCIVYNPYPSAFSAIPEIYDIW